MLLSALDDAFQNLVIVQLRKERGLVTQPLVHILENEEERFPVVEFPSKLLVLAEVIQYANTVSRYRSHSDDGSREADPGFEAVTGEASCSPPESGVEVLRGCRACYDIERVSRQVKSIGNARAGTGDNRGEMRRRGRSRAAKGGQTRGRA